MANIIKRFASHRDDMRLLKFQRVRRLDAEWKLLRCPTEYCLPNLTPLWANRNLGANCSDIVSGGIFKREVNVTVCFHFCVNDAASERIVPFFGLVLSGLRRLLRIGRLVVIDLYQRLSAKQL